MIKDKNGRYLTEAEDIKKRWQEYTEELYQKVLDVLDQGSPALVLQMFLDYNSQKPSPPPPLARISGSWKSKNIWRTKVGDRCVKGKELKSQAHSYWVRTSST